MGTKRKPELDKEPEEKQGDAARRKSAISSEDLSSNTPVTRWENLAAGLELGANQNLVEGQRPIRIEVASPHPMDEVRANS